MKKQAASFLIIAVFSFFIGPIPTIAGNAVESASVHDFQDAIYGELLVKYTGESSARVISYESNTEAAEALTDLLQDDAVEYAQPNYVYRASAVPSDPLLSSQTHLSVIHARQAWDIQQSAEDVVIAVIDSGVDISHPDLVNNIWTNPDEMENGIDDDNNGLIDDIHGWDFRTDEPDPSPKYFPSTPEDSIGVQHGTMVAGIMAASGNNGIGVSGVAWKAQIMPLRVLNHIGIGTSETVTVALAYAIEKKVDIINLSLVGTDFDPIVVDLLNEAYEQGIIVIAAAGNTGANLNVAETYPVCYNHLGPATVIGVGSIDDNFGRPGFSNYGGDCVDIVAPGVKIFSTRFVDTAFVDKSRYAALFSGTSFSAPQVTGVVALMKQIRPSLTSEEALAFLQSGATPISDIHASGLGFDYALDAQGTLELFEQYNAQSPEEQEEEITEIIEKSSEIVPEFLVYPLQEFGAVAFKYQLPGPLLQTPVVFAEEVLSKGMRMHKYSPFTALLSAWRGGSKNVYRYNFLTGEVEQLFEVDITDEQTVGNIAVGNVDFDEEDDIVIVSGPQAKPLVSIYNFDGVLKHRFQAYDDSVNEGLSVALVDQNNDGVHEIVTSPVNQSDGHIKVFEFNGLLVNEWVAYENFGGGATVSSADINNDEKKEILVGPGASGGPHVKIFDLQGELLFEFFGGDVVDGGGAHIDFLDFDLDGGKEFVLSFKNTHTPVIRTYTPLGEFKQEFGVMDGGYTGGIGILPLN